MRIILHTLATDDDNGTSSGAFATEDEMWDSLIEGTGKWSNYTRADADEWLKEQGNPELTYHDWWEEHRGDLDSYTCDEVGIDIDLCAQPLPDTGVGQVKEAIECLQRARDLLKASDNKQTLKRVRLALSSAKGAARIQDYRRSRLIREAETLHNSADLDEDGEPDTQSHCGACGRLVGDHNVGEYDDECTLPPFTDEEKADQKHNATMLDGCETEDELNAELRAQTQGN